MQNFEDEDVGATLEWLKEKLADNIKLLSSWDKYKKEVLSGSLEWSPMHTSEGFWLENSPKFEERDCQVRHTPGHQNPFTCVSQVWKRLPGMVNPKRQVLSRSLGMSPMQPSKGFWLKSSPKLKGCEC